MCKVGDIILVEHFNNEFGKGVERHPFIIISTKQRFINMIPFDIMAVLLSSFKNEDHKTNKLTYEGNIEIKRHDGVKKDSFIKAKDLYCFDSKNTKFIKVGTVDVELFLKLQKEISYFIKNGKVKIIASNLEICYNNDVDNDLVL